MFIEIVLLYDRRGKLKQPGMRILSQAFRQQYRSWGEGSRERYEDESCMINYLKPEEQALS